jgi:hypothetical protein
MINRLAVSVVLFWTVVVIGSGAWALQAGGVEIGDLETGSEVGQPFKELTVDLEIYTTEVSNLKILYPPVSVLDLRVRPGTPVVIKVVNKSSMERGFLMTDMTNGATPTVLRVQVVLKPGETKYVGVPLSDLLYATQGNTLIYGDPLNPKDPGGKLVLLK